MFLAYLFNIVVILVLKALWDLKWYWQILLDLEIEQQSILSYHSRHGS